MKRFATEAIHLQQAKTKAGEPLKRHEHHRRTHPLPLVQATVPCVRSMYVRMYVRTPSPPSGSSHRTVRTKYVRTYVRTYALQKVPLEARTHTTTAGEQYHLAQLRASQDLKIVEQPTGDCATHGG